MNSNKDTGRKKYYASYKLKFRKLGKTPNNGCMLKLFRKSYYCFEKMVSKSELRRIPCF